MPYPLRNILAPIQFDDPEFFALRVARHFAIQNGAALWLLHVVPHAPAINEPGVGLTAHSPEEQKAKTEMEGIAAERLDGVKYQILTRVAEPTETPRAILEAARVINADLIVMKTHGRRGLAHLILGSVTEAVVREANCAVMTLTSSAEAKLT